MKLPSKKNSKKPTPPEKIVLSASTITERQQMERVNRIHGFFNSGGKTNAPELAKKLHVSEQTIWRAFAILSDDWDMPLFHDPKLKKSY